MAQTAENAVNPITERVVANAFHSICEEMGHTMIRTANSGLFVEGRDFSCALIGPDAELVATANYDPSHLSAMAITVESALIYLGVDTVKPGDVYLVNEPYVGGGHLPDITLIRPVFHDSRLLGYAVNRAHHIDIGGMAVAGFPGTATSIYQEGLRIPPIRWFSEGRENRDVIEMIVLNQRFSRDQLGDFQAQLASAVTAERRLQALADKYGHDVVLACMQATKDHSEALVRALLSEMPDGTYTFEDYMEDDGATAQPHRLHAAVTIAGDRIKVDFSATSPQATGPINSSYGNTLSATFNALLQLVGPDVAFNHGCFRPVEVVAPRGTLLNPVPPAPCFGGVTEVSIRIIDVILGALAPVASDKAGAGCYGTCINFSGGGFDPERKQPFGFYFFVEGGWGASAWRDGWSCTPNPTSNYNDYPVEWAESELPVRYLGVRLNTDSGGPGRHRGGVGVVRSLELLADDVELNALGDRFKIQPYGLNGGQPGGANGVAVRTSAAAEWMTVDEALGSASPSKFHNLRVGRGTQFRIATGGGGGYGPALERPAEEVVDDVVAGYVSREGAERDYGVIVSETKTGALSYDAEATRRRRAEMAGLVPDAVERAEARLAAAREAAANDALPDVFAQDIAAVERLVAQVSPIFEAEKDKDERAACGRSLRNPFLNDRTLRFWDSYALERWLARNGVALGR